jgi:hypothetical protein
VKNSLFRSCVSFKYFDDVTVFCSRGLVPSSILYVDFELFRGLRASNCCKYNHTRSNVYLLTQVWLCILIFFRWLSHCLSKQFQQLILPAIVCGRFINFNDRSGYPLGRPNLRAISSLLNARTKTLILQRHLNQKISKDILIYD